MLVINKNNISFTKGESVNIRFTILNTNGEPYILPPKPFDDEGTYTWVKSMVAVTVRSDTYDKIVLAKYLDLDGQDSFITLNSITDTTEGGYNKFITQKVDGAEDVTDYFTTEEENKLKVVKKLDDGTFWFWSEPYGANEYSMDFVVQFNSHDTATLQARHYKYDVIFYMGRQKALIENFPMSEVIYKKELIPPHSFILGDTLNA